MTDWTARIGRQTWERLIAESAAAQPVALADGSDWDQPAYREDTDPDGALVDTIVEHLAQDLRPSDREIHRRALRRAVLGTFDVQARADDDVSPFDADREPQPETAPDDDYSWLFDEAYTGGDSSPFDPVDTDDITAPRPLAHDDLRARADAALAEPCETAVRLRRRGILFTLVVALCLALLAMACDGQHGTVLWHAYNGAEREALEASAARWNTDHPDKPLVLVAVPYGGFADKLTSAIPNGNGPDLFIYQQGRIGAWAEAGVLEPIEYWVDDARADRFRDDALAAMAYDGFLWGLPLTEKSLVLYYRTDLVAEPPATTDALLALAPKMRAKQGYAVAYANVDLYGHAPWLFGYGGRILDDAGGLAIATPEAASAMRFARQLVTTGAAPDNCEGPLVATLFNEGKTATAISGPWFMADIQPNVPWQVATLPVVSATGNPAAPFLDVEGILMSSRAHDKATAFAIMDALTADAAALDRARRTREVVPNVAVYGDPEIARDPAQAAFRAQLAHAVATPKHAAMRMVWTPYQTALGEVISGRAEPQSALLKVEAEVAKYRSGAGR